jgi:hypothetical protein
MGLQDPATDHSISPVLILASFDASLGYFLRNSPRARSAIF